MSGPLHGINGLIYVSGSELSQANAWSINITGDKVPTLKFGDTWTPKVKGANDWSASLTEWGESDSQALETAAVASVSVAVLIYPDRNTLTSYYSGNAFFEMSGDGNATAAFGRSANLVGDSTLTITGFA